ncbi:MAG TPA: ornithine cyclodeaminase family protein [Burkholderiales bacterium]|nr:ornithine cyclodeaminase family protein [Burkholderiales bacterium]
MSGSIPFIDARAAHAALDWPVLIDALRAAFRAGGTTPLRASYPVTSQGDRLLLMPAWDAASLGVKIVTVFPRNPARGLASVSALYLLMDAATGYPRALIDGEALTLRRTAAASALASLYLSRPDSRTLLVVGSGRLAPHLASAHSAVRPITRVLVWGRTTARAEAVARELLGQGLPAESCADLDAGLAAADIVTCATTAREPVVRGALVRPGTHVDLVGAFTAEMRESDDELIERAAVFVDTFAGAFREAGDLMHAIDSGAIARADVRAELADLCAGSHAGRGSPDEITLFKSVGTALEDLCAARLVFERAASSRQ